MGDMVLLRHDLPDSSSHFDWMLQRESPAGPPPTLITFRLEPSNRPDFPAGTPFRAQRLADHRAAYLTHEGPVSGGRGVVTRLARGCCRVLRDEPSLLEIEVQFDQDPGAPAADTPEEGRIWVGRPSGDGPWWEFRLANGP